MTTHHLLAGPIDVNPSALSKPGSRQAGRATAFAAPANQTANDPSPTQFTAAPTVDLRLSLAWKDNADNESGYFLYRSDNGAPTVLVATLPANTTTYLDASVSPYSAYTYTLQAFDASGPLGGTATVSVPAQIASLADRRQLLFNTMVANPSRVSELFWRAQAYFQLGMTAQGKVDALTASRSLLADYQGGQAEVQMFDSWPGLDTCIRYGTQLDAETVANVRTVVCGSTYYSIASTQNLLTLAHVIRFLGSEYFGEAAFVPGASYGASDPTGRANFLTRINDTVTLGGFRNEYASRPYFWYSLGSYMSTAQLAQDQTIRQRAALAVEAVLAQNAGFWLDGLWPLMSGRTYPDMLSNDPGSSTGFLWYYYGGAVLRSDLTTGIAAAVINYPLPPVAAFASTQRATPFTCRASFRGNYYQTSYVEPGYALISETQPVPSNVGQTFSDSVMWLDTNINHHTHLWLGKPSLDDSTVQGSHPHGADTTYFAVVQNRDTLAYIFNIDSTKPFPYALSFIPGGYLALINDAANTGKVFLAYPSVLIAISCDQTFSWDPTAKVLHPADPLYPGDSEFRVTGTQFGMAIECAPPSEFPAATPAAQLAAFRDALAGDTLVHSTASPPTVTYKNRRGETLQRTAYTTTNQAASVNGAPLDFVNWPQLDNPWMHQGKDNILSLFESTERDVYDFNAYTKTTQTAPTVAVPAMINVGPDTFTDIDLRAYASDAQTPTAGLRFTVSGAVNGTVTLLPDGHTARFTPTIGYRGPAAFIVSVRDASPDPQRLLFYYDYEDQSLTSKLVTDRSLHARNGTLDVAGSGTYALALDAPAALAGTSATSLQLNEAAPNAARITRTVAVADLNMSNASWTFSTWFKRATRNTEDFIFYMGNSDGYSGSTDELQLNCPANSDTVELLHFTVANANDVAIRSAATVSVNTWHQVAVSFERTGTNTGNVRLYLDGALVNTVANVTWTLPQSYPLVLGGCAINSGSSVSRWFNGSLDDSALFNVALPAGDVASLTTGSVGQLTGLSTISTLNVNVLTALESWRLKYFGTLSNTGNAADTADANGDGESNLYEFATGQDPNAAGTRPGSLVRNGANLEFTYTRSKAALGELSFQVEWSDTLAPGSWSSAGVTEVTPPLTDDGVLQTIKVLVQTDATIHRRFVHLRVTRP